MALKKLFMNMGKIPSPITITALLCQIRYHVLRSTHYPISAPSKHPYTMCATISGNLNPYPTNMENMVSS
jgi:hypothetical protein